MITYDGLDEFTRAYLEAAIWASTHPDFQTDRATDDTPETLDEYAIIDFSQEALQSAIAECKRFQNVCKDIIEDEENCINNRQCSSESYAGHDFWLTRNGHGCGFWDGDWPLYGDFLTELSTKFGELYIWINEKNQLEFEQG